MRPSVGLARKIGCHYAIRICLKRQLAPDLITEVIFLLCMITEVLGNHGNAMRPCPIYHHLWRWSDGVERTEKRGKESCEWMIVGRTKQHCIWFWWGVVEEGGMHGSQRWHYSFFCLSLHCSLVGSRSLLAFCPSFDFRAPPPVLCVQCSLWLWVVDAAIPSSRASCRSRDE